MPTTDCPKRHSLRGWSTFTARGLYTLTSRQPICWWDSERRAPWRRLLTLGSARGASTHSSQVCTQNMPKRHHQLALCSLRRVLTSLSAMLGYLAHANTAIAQNYRHCMPSKTSLCETVSAAALCYHLKATYNSVCRGNVHPRSIPGRQHTPLHSVFPTGVIATRLREVTQHGSVTYIKCLA